MLSEYQRGKLSARFAQLDGNGTLEQRDLESLGNQLCDRLVPADRTDERAEVMGGYAELWQLLSSEVDTDGDGDGTVSEGEYLAAMDTGVLADSANYDSSVGRIVTALFRALDAVGNEQLDMEGLVALGSACDMDASDMEDLFGQLDSDGDGTVSLDEFQAAVRDFYMSDDPQSAGNLIFTGVS